MNLADLNQAAAAWWPQVAHATWQNALVAAILLAIVWFGRRWPSTWRHALLLLAVLKFAIPPTLSLPTGLLSHAGPQFAAVPAIAPASTTARDFAPEPPPAFSIPPVPTETIVEETKPSQLPPTINFTPLDPAPKTSLVVQNPLPWKTWLMLIHTGGTLFMLAAIGWQWRRLKHWARHSQSLTHPALARYVPELARRMKLARIPQVRLSPDAPAPMALGVLRPVILLPASALERLPESELRTIIAHELAHFRRGDLWFNWLQMLLQAIWWFHPVLWILNHAARKSREDCCDDLLLCQQLTTSDAYCETLVKAATEFARPEPVAGALGFGERLHPLSRRLARIMDHTLPRAYRLPATGVVTMVLLGLVLLPGLRSEPSPTTPPKPASVNMADSKPDATQVTDASTNVSLKQLFLEIDPKMGENDVAQKQKLAQFLQLENTAGPFLTNQLFENAISTRKDLVEKRTKAAWLLGKLGPTNTIVIPALIQSLDDEWDEVVDTAAEALGEMGPAAKPAVPALIESMRFGNHNAVYSLAKIAPESEAVALAYLELIDDKLTKWTLRHSIINNLRHLKTRRAEVEATLVALSKTEQPAFRDTIVYMLQKLRAQSPEARAIVRQQLANRRQEVLKRKKLTVEEVRAKCNRMLHSVNSNDRLDALNDLFYISPACHEAIPTLVTYFQTTTNLGRQNAINLLGKMGPAAKDAVPALIPMLREPEETFKSTTAYALGCIGPDAKAALPDLEHLFRSSTGRLKYNAARALWQVDSNQITAVLPTLIAYIKASTQEYRSWLARDLGIIGPPARDALPILLSWIKTADPDEYAEYAEAIWRIDPSQGESLVPGLIKVVEDDINTGRAQAAALLAKIGTKAHSAIATLQKCLPGEDEELRTAATQAISAIQNQSASRKN